VFQHVANGEGGYEPIVIAASEGRLEKEVSGLFKADKCTGIVSMALDVGVPGFPILTCCAIGGENRVGQEEAGRLHIGDKARLWMLSGNISRKHDADLVCEDLLAFIVDDPATVAIAIEGETEIGLGLGNRIAQGIQHCHVFRVRVVVGEGVVERAVKRNHIQSHGFQHLRCKRTSRTVAASHDRFEAPRICRSVLQICHIAFRKIAMKMIAAAIGRLGFSRKYDLLQGRHVVGPECQGAVEAHLDAGPAIVVVACRHHGNAFDVQRELRKVSHWRESQADVMNVCTASKKAGYKSRLDTGRVGSVVMPYDDPGRLATLPVQSCQTESNGLNPHEIDLVRVLPAGIILPETRRLDQRKALELSRVRLKIGSWLRKHR